MTVTSGARAGTNGPRPAPAVVAYAIVAAALLVVGIVNTLSVLDERSWLGRPIAWWEPAVWEGSSGVVLLSLAWAPMWAIRRFPVSGPAGGRHLALQLALTIPFSLVHVGAMVALRKAAYALAGDDYGFGANWNTWLYEYRKDILSYALFAAIYWLCARLIGSAAPARPAHDAGVAARDPVVIDEGQRVLRVAPAEILAARSAGNYVEFLIADGRRPLMRATLAGIDEQLAPKGFVRIHRSWLVNPVHVAAIEAEGSGDYGLTLGDGTQVPLSRRYRHAMEKLRAER
jgi:hypothetical protein